MTRQKDSAEKAIRDIRRATRRQYSVEEKIRIVLEGLRVEDSIAELCRKEGINQNLYYRWSKEFLEAGKKRLAGDTAREAAKARIILRDLLGPIQMCPGKDGSLWAQYDTRPAALIKRAVGASVELSGSGGVICSVPTVGTRVRLK